MRCRPSIAVAVAVISTISTPATSVLELEEAQQATAVAALGEVAVVVQRGGQRPQLVVGDEALTVGSRLGRADQQALAALLARHPRLGAEQRVEGADVQPPRGARHLAHPAAPPVPLGVVHGEDPPPPTAARLAEDGRTAGTGKQ